MNPEDITSSFHSQILDQVLKNLPHSEIFDTDTVNSLFELANTGGFGSSDRVAAALRIAKDDQIGAA